MSYLNTHLQRISPQYQQLQAISVQMPTCPHCIFPYNMRLPNLEHFQYGPFESSTRIYEFYLDVNNCWQFKNFNGEVYYRSTSSPRVWFLQLPGWNSATLCERAAAELDQTYGRFLPPHQEPHYPWLYYGYVKHYHPNTSCFISFSSEEFYRIHTERNRQNNPDTLSVSPALHTHPPPGYSTEDKGRNVLPMDVDNSQSFCLPEKSRYSSGGQLSVSYSSNQPNQGVVQNTSQSINPSWQDTSGYQHPSGVHSNSHPSHQNGDEDINRVIGMLTSTTNYQPSTPMDVSEAPEQRKVNTCSDRNMDRDFGMTDKCHASLSPTRNNQTVTPMEFTGVRSQNRNESPLKRLGQTDNSQTRTRFQGNIAGESNLSQLPKLQSASANGKRVVAENANKSSDNRPQANNTPTEIRNTAMHNNGGFASTSKHETREQVYPTHSGNDQTKNLNTPMTSNGSYGSSKQGSSPLNPETRRSSQWESNLEENRHFSGKLQPESGSNKLPESAKNEVKNSKSTGKQRTAGLTSPVHNVHGGKLQTREPKGQNLPSIETEDEKAEKVFVKLQNVFVEKYKSQTKVLPAFAKELETGLSSVFDLMIKYQDEKTKKVVTGDFIFKSFSKSKRKLLLQGGPGFGKTTVMYMLARQWSSKIVTHNNCPFKLCIACLLSDDIMKKGLILNIVNSCTGTLNSPEHSVDLVEKALAQKSDKILLLLDGYDALTLESQKCVLSFLKFTGIFSNSYIVITTRPSSDIDLLKVFDIHVFIRGFSAEILQRALSQNHQTEFFKVFSQQSLMYLLELSPYWTSILVEVIRTGLYKCKKAGSLYHLLDRVIQLIFSEKVTGNFPPDHLQLLGSLLFKALISNTFTFTENELERVFGDHFNSLLLTNVFYRQTHDRSKLSVSSRLLMVFFATMYLRNSWDSLSCDEERWTFLKQVLCDGCCSGDYVKTENGSLYYVGLLPEVVLKNGSNRSLKDCTIEMYYDVDRIECSHAFDSVNLLSRIHTRHLGRFGFQKEPNDCRYHTEIFGDVLNLLSFDGSFVDYSFYSNVSEGKDFLLVDVQGNTAVLQAIVRAARGGKIDRIYVDFACSEMKEVFDFVNSLLSTFIKDVKMSAELKKCSLSVFMEVLISNIFSSRTSRSVTVSCSSDARDSNSELNVCFSISYNQEKKERFLIISHQRDHNSASFSKYSSRDYSKVTKEIQTIFKDSENVSANLRLTISAF